jgi:hypothetical protein
LVFLAGGFLKAAPFSYAIHRALRASNLLGNISVTRARRRKLDKLNFLWRENSTTVPVLLKLGCPHAIRGLIVAVVVNTLDAISLAGSRSHIGQEVLEHIPSFADGNTACAVSIVVVDSWIPTPIAQIQPGGMLPRPAVSMPLVFAGVGSARFAAVILLLRLVAD